MTTKPQTVLPEGTTITLCRPGRARGLKKPLMRAVGERGTESRLPVNKRPTEDEIPGHLNTLAKIAALKL